MSNRMRIAASLGVLLLALLGGTYLLARVLLLRNYVDLEAQNARQDVARVLDGIANELDRLDATTIDYASWDDTYRYAVDQNPEFISATFDAQTLVNLRVSLVIIADASGRILLDAAVAPNGTELTTVPASLLDQLPVIGAASREGGLPGTLLLPEGALFVAARPILTSQAQGPARGMLIVGRYFDAAEQDRLARLTHLTFRWRRADDATATSARALIRAQAALTPEIEPVDDERLIGRAWFPDINGGPALVLELETPRTLFKQGQTSLAYFMGLVTLLGVLSTGVLLMVVDRWSASRRRELESEARYRSLFTYSPVALTQQDFSAVKQRLEALREQGVSDFGVYLARHPDEVAKCLTLIQIKDANDVALALYGAHDKAELAVTLDRILPPDGLDLFRKELIWIVEGRGQFEGEGINQTLIGQRIDVRVHWLAAPGSEASLAKVFVVVEDITAHRAAEAALRLSEERYRLITENVSDTVWLMDLSLKITFISPSVTVKRGFTLDELQAMSFDQHMTPASLAVILAAFAQELTPERLADPYLKLSRTLELEFYKKEGSTFWSEATFTLIRDEHGQPTGLLGVGRDITQRKQRERELEALLRVAASLRAAPTHGDLLPAIVNQVLHLIRVDGAALVMRHPASGECVIVMARGEWDEWTGLRLPFERSVTGQVMTTGRPYLNNKVRTDPLFALADRLGTIRSAACAPLATQEAVIGALWIGRTGDIDESDLKLLVGITEMAANALYRAGLMETLEQRVADRTRELSEANLRLQELDRAKDQFVSNVSHELRTPLANIKLYLSLLERGKPDKYGEYLQTLRREQGRLEKMIDDLLDLSRLDLGVTRIEPVPTQLDHLLRQLVADRVNLAIERGLTLDYEAASDLPLALVDPERLTEVVTNLVTNAINYTPSGGSVLVQVDVKSSDDRWVTFTVRDTGPGVSAKDLPHLFERFYRGEVGRRASAPGTGLGLAISKEIIDRLGGRITVESEPGYGAAFTVWLRPAAS